MKAKEPFKILSSPITDILSTYEVVVVGSGYGGSIAASRMARMGKSVCLLEKGKEFLPGEFPDSELQAADEMQFNLAAGHVGYKTNLFEFHSNKDINVLVGCGLGGTSLINANVSIEPDRRIFDDQRWPVEIRNDYESFQRGVRRAAEMLRPSKYPEGKEGYPKLAKVQAMKHAASELKEKFEYIPINVNFSTSINQVGITQSACNLCGDCVTGCNHGSKNTTAMNYLPDAKNHGAKIFTEVEVLFIQKIDSKWLLYYQPQGTGREKFDAPPLFIRADIVILGAGSLGSTKILLRSKEHGLLLSDLLGKNFTGNGDVLGFGYNNDRAINGIGIGKMKKKSSKLVGPCITTVIDLRSKPRLEDGFVIQDGSIPGALSSILPTTFMGVSQFIGNNTDKGLIDSVKEKIRELTSLIGGAYRGALNNTLTYLVMSHDDGKGTMRLEKDRLRIDWPGVGKQPIFKKINDSLQQATRALGGTYVCNPIWTRVMDFDIITVHPLGGCIMADTSELGVVNHIGQVYSSKSGKDLHEGLYIMDGAIIPRSLGVNPLLTISALAERACEFIANQMGIKLFYDFDITREKVIETKKVGIQFTETMSGYFSRDNSLDFHEGYSQGIDNDSSFIFTLTIKSDNLDAMLQSPEHGAKMFGTVVAPMLSSKPITVSNARFNLLMDDTSTSEAKKMYYSMNLTTVDGKEYHFIGYKNIHDDKGFDLWNDTTTLFITIYEGRSQESPIFGKGILAISLDNFAKQISTLKVVNSPDKIQSAIAMKKFGMFFSKSLIEVYS